MPGPKNTAWEVPVLVAFDGEDLQAAILSCEHDQARRAAPASKRPEYTFKPLGELSRDAPSRRRFRRELPAPLPSDGDGGTRGLHALDPDLAMSSGFECRGRESNPHAPRRGHLILSQARLTDFATPACIDARGDARGPPPGRRLTCSQGSRSSTGCATAASPRPARSPGAP